jgi:hypothetical protein
MSLTDAEDAAECCSLDRRRAWRVYDDITKAECSALIVLFTCVSDCA